MKTYRSMLLGATTLVGVGAGPVFAQESTAPPADETASGNIIVTATRRATSIQDVPLNITAIGTEDIQRLRLDDIRDVGDFTPGVTIIDTGPGSTGAIVLRGLNASDNSATGDSYDNAMGVYLGEVPLYFDFKLLDIARVETLLGPQGTLYGLGTLAGAIRSIPNRPDTSNFEAEAHGRLYGKSQSGDAGYQIDGVINLPIVRDLVAFRSVTGYYFDPGFIDYPLILKTPGVSLPQPSGTTSVTDADRAANFDPARDLNYERTFTTRNQLLFQLSPDLSVNFTYAFQRTKTEGTQTNSDGVLGTGRYESAKRFREPVNRRAHLAAMEINANLFGIADLVSTTAYTNVRNRASSDNTDLLLDLDYGYESFPAFSSFNESDNRREQINQEVRFVSSHGGPFSWVLGGFYNEQKLQNDYTEFLPGHPWVDRTTNPDEIEYASFTRSKVTERALFGEGTFRVTPEWQVTAGLRWFNYTSDIRGRAVLPLLGDPLSPYDLEPAGGETEKSGTVWKFNTSYDLTPDVMVYATYSKGYRIGGPNSVAPCPPVLNPPPAQNVCALPNEQQYGPDTTKNAEIGIRTQWFDRKLTFNFNLFQIKWDGIQVASATLNGVAGITVNGGKAKSEGFETQIVWLPIQGLLIQGTYSYVDARLTQDVPGIIAVNSPPATYPSEPIQLSALAGDRLPGSARHSGSLGATYTHQLGDADIVANWTASYVGDVVTRLGWDRAFGDKLPGYTLHRASIFYEGDRYSIGLFANNIFDKYAVSAISNDRSRTGLNDGVVLRYLRQAVINPRTVGIEARIRY